MAGTYGAAGLNPYTITGIGGILSNEIDATTGVTQIYRGTSLTRQESIGTYNPSTGQFTPDANANLTENEKKALSNSQNIKIIRDKSIETATRAGATNAQQLLSPNSAPSGSNPDPEAPQQGGATGPNPSVPSLPGPGEVIQTGDLKNNQLQIAKDAGLRYPINIASTTQDRIKFTALKIKARTQPQIGAGLQTKFNQPTYEKVDGSVFLAIQSPISDQNSVDWGPDTINALDSALYAESYNAMKGTEDVGSQIQNFAGKIMQQARSSGELFQRYLAGQAAGVNNILARTDNVVLNPNLELLFQGPQLRPFSFQFKMSARNQPEANEIKKIIKYFKYHMAVREEKTGLFLRAPHVFGIEYIYKKYGESLHPGLNLMKVCALTNCSVDYTPLGSYMTYEDGTMVAYTLSLQFQELTPIYDTDYVDSEATTAASGINVPTPGYIGY